MRMLDEIGPTATLRRITDESVAVAGQVAAIRWFGSAVRLMAGAILIIALAGVLFAVRRWAESVAWEVALRRSLGARRRRVAGSIILRIMGMAWGGGILGALLYQQIGVAALAGSLPSQPGVSPSMLIAVVLPVLLAVVVGSISAFRLLYRPPASILR
jgi:predicted lysophospholipase L1 biosynthesis ABC-type transport system permease subunit